MVSAHLQAQDDGNRHHEDPGVADDVREGADAIENLYRREGVKVNLRGMRDETYAYVLVWHARRIRGIVGRPVVLDRPALEDRHHDR